MRRRRFGKLRFVLVRLGSMRPGEVHHNFTLLPFVSLSPSPSAHHTMSLLTSILGFSAFGFGARCLQLGIQKRPIFEGKPRQPALPLTSLSRLPWPCIRRDRFRHGGRRSIPLGQQTVRDSDVCGGELTGSAAGRSCSQRRRRPCSSNGRRRTWNGLRGRERRMPCSSLGCSVYQLARRVSTPRTTQLNSPQLTTRSAQLTTQTQPCPSSPPSFDSRRTHSPLTLAQHLPATSDQDPVG